MGVERSSARIQWPNPVDLLSERGLVVTGSPGASQRQVDFRWLCRDADAVSNAPLSTSTTGPSLRVFTSFFIKISQVIQSCFLVKNIIDDSSRNSLKEAACNCDEWRCSDEPRKIRHPKQLCVASCVSLRSWSRICLVRRKQDKQIENHKCRKFQSNWLIFFFDDTWFFTCTWRSKAIKNHVSETTERNDLRASLQSQTGNFHRTKLKFSETARD